MNRKKICIVFILVLIAPLLKGDFCIAMPEAQIRQDLANLKKEKNEVRIDFYKRRVAKYRVLLKELEEKYGVAHDEIRKTLPN